jgi:ACS family hexuronate transporter-like MFS transporter
MPGLVEPDALLPETGTTDRRTAYRWVICALLFLATTINYIDRLVLGILAPTLQTEIGWSEAEYGNIVAAFSMAYAGALLLFGGLIDRIGTRVGYAVAIVGWSIAAAAHALVRTPFGFAAARFALGLGEAGNFPAAVKTISEWFPKKERALAVGIFNSGTNVGAILAPLLVPFLALNYGWQWAFIVTGALGLIWLVAWLALYRDPAAHPAVSPAELAHIRSDPAEPTARIPWLRLLPHRQTWAFALGKFMTDPVWWFYLYWLPKYLKEDYGITLGQVALPLIVAYLIADVGSIAGGWLSTALIQRGWSVNRGRKTAFFTCACLVVPVVLAPHVGSMWGAVLLIGLAAGAHQGWSANMFAMATDTFPRRAVASVVGIGGFCGSIGGMLFQSATGYYLEWSGNNYMPLFFVCGLAYLAAFALVHALNPRLEPARLDDPSNG